MTHTGWRSGYRRVGPGRRADGQVLVLFVLGVVGLILVAGLVVDGGNAFLNRRQAQNTADLAALAGTKAIADWYMTLPTSTASTVYSAIAARAVANGCSATGVVPCSWSASFVNAGQASLGSPMTSGTNPTGSIPTGAQGVTVQVTQLPSTYFLGVIGQGKWTVQTTATALTGNLGPGAGSLLPIGVNPPTSTGGGPVTLTSETSYGPGNFGWLSWTGSNQTNVLADSICAPDNSALSLPTPVPGDPGVKNASDVRSCLNKWIGSVIYVPVFDTCSPCNGNGATFHVIGYTAFFLESYTTKGGAINTLSGYFVTYTLSSIGSAATSGATSLAIELVH
jgi:Flp pilus assembly protein TadG